MPRTTFRLPIALLTWTLLASPLVAQISGELRDTPAPPVALPAELMNDTPAADLPATSAAVSPKARVPATKPSAMVLRDASARQSSRRQPTASGLRITPEPTQEQVTAPVVPTRPSTPRTALMEPIGGVEPRQTQATQQPTADVEVALRPFKLRGVTPGDSTAAELTAAWGEDRKESTEGDAKIWQYELEPFPVVRAAIRNDVVEQILVEMPEPQPVAELVKMMKISDIRPGRIDDARGESLGLVFPERGVAFALLPSKQEQPVAVGALQVGYIVIEPIAAEPFVRRAEADLLGPCEANLRDLERAVQLDPRDAHTRFTLALFLHSLGRHADALRAVTAATQLDKESLGYQLLKAEVLAELGQSKEAADVVAAVLAAEQATTLEKAQATLLTAELKSRQRKANFGEIVAQRRAAISMAEKLAESDNAVERRAAKRLLMSAHLGIARDVARGQFKSKETVVPQWVTRGAQYAEDLILQEYGDELLRIEVARQAMTALESLDGAIDPTKAVERTQGNAEKLMAATDDPLRDAWVQWNLGLILHDAMRIQYERRQIKVAEQFGELAIKLLEEGSRMRQPTAGDSVRLGQLYFQLGAVEAVVRRDHAAAVKWFEKSLPLLDDSGADAPVVDLGRHGESFVSMGVSYWSTGSRDEAVLITQRGMRFMEQAVEEGTLSKEALGVPYSNMAAMHRQLGQETEAASFANLAAKSRETVQK